MSDSGVEIKGDGETWEEYAHRLEHRIKRQRDQLDAMNTVRKAGNVAARKKIAKLTTALGLMTLRWERERDCRRGLLERLDSEEAA
jgi:hypothetical protein